MVLGVTHFMSRNNTAIFSTGDAGYLKHMAIALFVACKHNRNFDPWIITDASKEETKFLEKFGISVIRIDLHDQYDVFNETWPSQSFWWSIGPNMFNDLDYDYSIFIDGDVYCNKKVDLDIFNDDLEIAARSDEPNKYNSGVMLFNNKRLVETDLYTSALNCYRGLSTKAFEEWHGGKVHDQQVLTALGPNNELNDFLGSAYQFEIQDLDVLWNYPFNLQKGRNEELIKLPYSVLKERVYFVHFLLSQPWLPFKEWGSRNHGLFKTEDFPDGWVVKTKDAEPDPSIRVQFVIDWRNEVRLIERIFEEKLFDDFDDLFEGLNL